MTAFNLTQLLRRLDLVCAPYPRVDIGPRTSQRTGHLSTMVVSARFKMPVFELQDAALALCFNRVLQP